MESRIFLVAFLLIKRVRISIKSLKNTLKNYPLSGLDIYLQLEYMGTPKVWVSEINQTNPFQQRSQKRLIAKKNGLNQVWLASF